MNDDDLELFEELMAESDEVRAAVQDYIHEAYERGVQVGERKETARLSRMIDNVDRLKGTP